MTVGRHDKTIMQMALSGKRATRIATELDCDTGVVARRLQALERKAKTLRIAGWTDQNAVVAPHRVTAGAHDGVLIAMAQQGARVVGIATRLDCDVDVVAERLRALGEVVRV